MNEQVDHPSHYTQGNIECIDALQAASTEEEFRGFLRLNVLKYLWRCGLKDDPLIEIGKAKWYLERLEKTFSKKENTEHATFSKGHFIIQSGSFSWCQNCGASNKGLDLECPAIEKL